MNILHLIKTDWIRGRRKQHSLLLYSICTFAFPFIDWRWVQALLCTGYNRKEEAGSMKGGRQEGSTGRMRRIPLGWACSHVIDCVIKDLSAWAELSRNLSVVLHRLTHCSIFLLQWDKNPGREDLTYHSPPNLSPIQDDTWHWAEFQENLFKLPIKI